MGGLFGILVLILAIVCAAVVVLLRRDFDRGINSLAYFFLIPFVWLLCAGLLGLRDGRNGFANGIIDLCYEARGIDPAALKLTLKDKAALLTGWVMMGVVGTSILALGPIRRRFRTQPTVSSRERNPR
jgi:hypothetical protein